MTRSFWAGLMAFSLVISAAAAGYLYFELQKRSTREVPLEKVSQVPSEPSDDARVDEADESSGDPADSTAEASALPASERADLRHIKFVFHGASAKEVSIIGDFNDWFAQPLDRNDSSWTVSLHLAPGTYEYMYKVDGRRVNDPYNKNVSKSGKSLLTVEPID